MNKVLARLSYDGSRDLFELKKENTNHESDKNTWINYPTAVCLSSFIAHGSSWRHNLSLCVMSVEGGQG